MDDIKRERKEKNMKEKKKYLHFIALLNKLFKTCRNRISSPINEFVLRSIEVSKLVVIVIFLSAAIA